MRLAVEISDICQLACPHCYLLHDWSGKIMSDTTLDQIDLSNCDAISIVGAEPLFNRSSLAGTIRLLRRAQRSGINRRSLISNGLNLGWALIEYPELSDLLTWIDVSMDAVGTENYKIFRGGSWDKFAKSIATAKNSGIDVSILNTLYRENATTLDDIITCSDSFSTGVHVLSPMFTSTRRKSSFNVTPFSSMKDVLQLVASSRVFRESMKVCLTIEAQQLKETQECPGELRQLAETLEISHKVRVSDVFPQELVRICIDGSRVSPEIALRNISQ